MSIRYNKFLLFSFIFLSSVTVISCKKSDKGLQSIESGDYTYDKMGNYSAVRMFTKNGEVKDQNLIDQYSAQHSIYINPVNSGSQDTFRIIDAGNMQYRVRNSINNSVLTKDFIIKKKDDHYEFESRDTLSLYTQSAGNPITNIAKYKPYYSITPAPMGYNIIKSLQYHYASPSGKTLIFPFINVIRFATISYQGQISNSFLTVNTVNNVFDEKFAFSTLTGDTLMIQSFNVTYKRL